MADFPTDLSAFADPNHPSHELYLAFTNFIRDNAGVFATALAANAVNTTSRMMMESPRVQRMIAGIPGPLGALTSMFSKLSVSQHPNATAIQSPLQEGLSTQLSKEDVRENSIAAELIKIDEKTYNVDKSQVVVLGQNKEELAVQRVFSTNNSVNFSVAVNNQDELDIAYVQSEMLVEYFSSLWGIDNFDAMKDDAINSYKDAVSTYLEYRYKNNNKKPHVFEHEFDVFVAELTKTVAILDWKNIVLRTVMGLEQSIIERAKNQIHRTLGKFLGVAGIVFNPTSLPSVTEDTYSGEYLGQISDDIYDFYNLKETGGFNWFEQAAAKLTWQTWGSESLRQVKKIEAYTLHYTPKSIEGLFQLVKEKFRFNGNVLTNAFHQMMRAGTSATNIHHLFKPWTKYSAEFFQESFSDAQLKEVHGKYIKNYNETLMLSDLPAAFKTDIDVIKAFTSALKNELATDGFGTYSENAIRQFLEGLFIQRCNNLGQNCDNNVREVFIEFFLVLSIGERFELLRARRRMDSLMSQFIACERNYEESERRHEQSKEKGWFEWAFDLITTSATYMAFGTAIYAQAGNFFTYLDNRNRVETLRRENAQSRDLIRASSEENGRLLSQLLGAMNHLSQNPAVNATAQQAAFELDNSRMRAITQEVAQALAAQQNRSLEQAGGSVNRTGIYLPIEQNGSLQADPYRGEPRGGDSFVRNDEAIRQAVSPAYTSGGDNSIYQNEEFARQSGTLPGVFGQQDETTRQGQRVSIQTGLPDRGSTGNKPRNRLSPEEKALQTLRRRKQEGQRSSGQPGPPNTARTSGSSNVWNESIDGLPPFRPIKRSTPQNV